MEDIAGEKEQVRNNKALGYEMQYPKGKDQQYKVNGLWVTRNQVPERRAYEKKRENTLHRFLSKAKIRMKSRNKYWEKIGRHPLGENEFLEKKTSYKLLAHYNEQIERYGEVCPITLVKFTTFRNVEKKKDKVANAFGSIAHFSNLSADRLLNNVNYTKQNTLFTVAGWNNARGDWAFDEFKYIFKDEIIERYRKIIIERFPDQAHEYV